MADNKEDFLYMTWIEFVKIAPNDIKEKLPNIFFDIDDDGILNVPDIAQQLGVSQETVRSWCRKGQLKVLNPVGRYKVKASDLKEFLWIHWRKRILKNLS